MTKQLIWSCLAGAMLLGLFIGSSPDVSALPTTLIHPVGQTAALSGNGPAVCNCTSSPATLQVCHSHTVGLRIGTDTIHVETGQSTSTCASQEAPPASCLYFRYNFECTPTFFGWHCDLVSTGLWDRPATAQTDC